LAKDKAVRTDKIAAGLTWRQLVEIEACARCGECLVWCPAYAQDPRESICSRGKLASLKRIVKSGLGEEEQKEFLEGLYECSACGQCHIVCPVRINTHELWEQARESLVKAGIPQPEQQIKHLAAIREFNNSFAKPQAERGLWAEKAWRAGLLKEPVRLWKEHTAPILYFAGCTASFDPAMQAVAVQSARLLQEAGIDFSILGPDEPCCASKLRRMGDPGFADAAQQRADLFHEQGIKTIIVSCAGCFKGLHSDYAGMLPASVEVLHLTEYLDRLIREGHLRPSRKIPMKVTYHDPCHLGRHNQIYREPRSLLNAIPGISLVEMQRHGPFSACCGMGGGLKLAKPEIQKKMSAARIRQAEETGAEAIVTPCQTCQLGLMTGTEAISSGLKVYHITEMLVRSVCPDADREHIEKAFTGTEAE
jgi:heterodisulfide reductase subunit D